MSIKAIARTYIEKIRPRAQAELDYFREQPSLELAIERAALAINKKDKRFSHQRRLGRVTLEQARQILLANAQRIRQSKSFDDLFNLVDTGLEPVSGIGELYVYDTSLRIGAKQNLLPQMVYLHAGTRIGARVLGLNIQAVALKPLAFPPEFRQLEPHEIEDVLCIFKDEIKMVNIQNAEITMNRRSWCS